MGTKILAIWYLFIFAGLQANSFTNAAFNDVEELNASLHVKWPIDEWDKSSLDFDVKGLERGGTCEPPPSLYAEIYNDGEDMTFSTWSWELFKVDNGKKVPISGVLDKGVVPMIKAKEKGMIKTSENLGTIQAGTYRFKVTKPDRPGQDAIWSEPIEIKDCPTLKKSSSEQETKVEEPAAETKESQPATEATTENKSDVTEKEAKEETQSESTAPEASGEQSVAEPKEEEKTTGETKEEDNATEAASSTEENKTNETVDSDVTEEGEQNE